MKLYWVIFDEELERADEVAVLDEDRDIKPQLQKWAAVNLGQGIDADDIKDVYEFGTRHDAEGRKYRVSIEAITPDNCRHEDTTGDGGKCLDCGLEME